MIRFTFVEAVGLKGGNWRVDFTSRTVLVTGPNGSGKSRIRNALEFVFGHKVEGAASGQGQGIVGLVAGDILRVTVGVEIDGTEHTICRERRFERGTFKTATLLIDGVAADAKTGIATLLGGDVVLNPGADLLNASADTLRAELARLALMLKRDGGDTEGMPNTPEALSAERERRKKAVNEANATLRAAQQSLDASVKRAPDSTVRPEMVEAAKADAAKARAAFDAWSQKHAAVKARHDAAEADVAKWKRQHALANEELIRLERECSALADVGTAEDALAKVATALRNIDAAETNLDFATDALNDAQDAKTQAASDVARLTEKFAAAQAAKKALEHDTCPTCGQVVTAALLGNFESVVTDCASALNGAQASLKSATDEVAEVSKEINGHRATIAELRRGHAAAQQAVASANALVGHKAALVKAVEVLAEINAKRPAAPDAVLNELRASEAQRPEVGDAEDRIAKMAAELNAHQRLLADKSARDAADTAATAAKRALAALSDYEETLVRAAIDEISLSASLFLAPTGWSFGISLEDGPYLCNVEGTRWFGAGLSGAQRVLLAAAISDAVLHITGAEVRIFMVEADELSGAALHGLLAGLSAGGDDRTALAVVITCHPVDDYLIPPIWQRLGDGFPSLAPTFMPEPDFDPAPLAALAVELEQADDGIAALGVPASLVGVYADPATVSSTEPEEDDDDWGGGWASEPEPQAPQVFVMREVSEAEAAELAAEAREAMDAAPLAPIQILPNYVEAAEDADTEAPEQALTVADAKAMLREAKLSADALRVLANKQGAKLMASSLLQLAGERAVSLGLGAFAFDAAITAAAAQHPKRGYAKRPAGDAATDGAEAGDTTDDNEEAPDADA